MDILAVARHARVSSATVSRVINGTKRVDPETEKRVRLAIEELNYRPNNSARSLRSGKNRLFGIMISDVRNPFFPDIIEIFEALAAQHGIDVTFTNTGYSEERLISGLQRLLDRGADGIAVLTSEINDEALALIRRLSGPIVFLNQPGIAGVFPNIAIDYQRGFREALQHLQLLGHERVAFISGPVSSSTAMTRKTEFLAAASSCGLVIRNEWILEGDHQLTGGKIAAARFFTLPDPPTAVICSNDLTAVGFLHAANRLNHKIPTEVSLIGVDDIAMSEVVQPPLTTVHISRREIATHAFYALKGADQKAGTANGAIILPQLVIRESTGPVRSD